MITGIKTYAILATPSSQGSVARPAFNDQVHTLFDRIKGQHLQEYLVTNIVQRSIVGSSHEASNKYRKLSERLRDMIGMKSLAGFDESIEPIITALGRRPHVLSKASAFHTAYQSFQDVDLKLLDVSQINSQSTGAGFVLLLRLKWWDHSKKVHTLPTCSMTVARYGDPFFHVDRGTNTYYQHHTEIHNHTTLVSQIDLPSEILSRAGQG